jgi:hypothetical protein
MVSALDSRVMTHSQNRVFNDPMKNPKPKQKWSNVAVGYAKQRDAFEAGVKELGKAQSVRQGARAFFAMLTKIEARRWEESKGRGQERFPRIGRTVRSVYPRSQTRTGWFRHCDHVFPLNFERPRLQATFDAWVKLAKPAWPVRLRLR